MLLKDFLIKEYTNSEIRDFATICELSNFSRCSKARLADLVSKKFCSEEIFRKRMAPLTDEQLELFRKAVKAPFYICPDEFPDAVILITHNLGSFDEETDDLFIFEDVAKAFKMIDDDDFKEDQSKKGWLVKCLDFATKYYGVVPVEVIYEIYSQKCTGTVEEMTELILEIPLDMTGQMYIPIDEVELNSLLEDNPLYSEYGLLVDSNLIEYEEVDDLIDYQMDIDFFIPSAKLVEALHKDGYESSSLEYKRFEKLLCRELKYNKDESRLWCKHMWGIVNLGATPEEIVEEIQDDLRKDHIEDLFTQDILSELIRTCTLAYNSTRTVENRGHALGEQKCKDLEIKREMLDDELFTSEMSSDELMEAMSFFEDMLEDIDFDEECMISDDDLPFT